MGILSSFFKDTSHDEELALVFNIGSSSVGGALFWKKKSGYPKIVLSIKENIPTANHIDIEDFLYQTKETLDRVSAKIASSSFGAPNKIFCILGSPWYVSQNRVIKMSKNTPFVFNQKLANSLINQEVKLFEYEHFKEYSEIGGSARVIELKNIKTVLNGYVVADTENQKAKELEMTLFISICAENVLSHIQQIVFKHFHERDIVFSSFLMASFGVIRDMYREQKDFLLVDIGGEVTDISMVKDQVLSESVSYPMGINSVIRTISISLNCTLDIAKSLFALYKEGHMEEKEKEKIEPIINNIKSFWLKQFQSSLSSLSHDISIPATIFLTLDREYADFFTEIIKTEQFSQYTLTESKFKIIFLNTDTLHGVATFENDTIRDPFLILDTVFINRFSK